MLNDDDLISIEGKVQFYLFHNSDNLYSVAKVKLYELNEKNVTIVGHFPKLAKDDMYRFSGYYSDNPRYGLQFVVVGYQRVNPSDTESLVRFFSGPLFPGIGKKYARSMIDCLGNDIIEKIKEDNSLLYQVPKMTTKKALVIAKGITQEDEDVQIFLQNYGVGIRNLQKIQQVYSDQAINIIKSNPYRLVEDIDGIGFQTADKIARQMGVAKDDPRRIRAYVFASILQLCLRSGDSYVKREQLYQVVTSELAAEDFSYFLNDLQATKQIYLEEDRVYHHSQYHSEAFIAEFLCKFVAEEPQEYPTKLIEEAISESEEEFRISYDATQKKAIKAAINNKLLILTGGPGTGKTTVVRAITKVLHKLSPASFAVLCAPTGRAAKRLNELTGNETSTIHSLLKWNLETNTFGKNINDPISYDVVIVDETSMVDNWLMYNLLLACHDVKKLILIGDKNQLPAVGPGALLRDLLAADLFVSVELSNIYRQKEGSEVIQLAYDILHNQDNISFRNEVKFIPCVATEIRPWVIKLVDSALDKAYDINDVQVFACKYEGIAGIDNLNIVLQQSFNPPSATKKELKHGMRIFRECDKILQLKNMNDDSVYNGDIGNIVEINLKSPKYLSTLTVDFDGVIVEYDYESLNNITLAYCISVHKAQGSEYPIVIMPFSKAETFMLDQRLIYTAITRCSKSLILLGDPQLFYRGIKTEARQQRLTTLQQRLLEDLNDLAG